MFPYTKAIFQKAMMEEDLELNSESDNRSKSHSHSVRKHIPIKLKSSSTSTKTRGRARKTVKAEPNQETHHGEQTRTDDDILREPPIFKSTNYQADPMHQSKRLKWDYNVRLIGEKVVDPLIHCCEKCTLPILIYGRMIPCKHVFCYDCAKKMDKICPRCDEEVQRIEQSALGTVFICTHGGSKHAFNGCRRTYLSQRDLQAHINHRHLRTSGSESHSKSSSHHHSAPAYTESHAKPVQHHPPTSSMFSSSPHQPMDHGMTTAPVSRAMAVDQAVYRPMEGIPNRPPPQLPAHMQPHPQMLSQAPPPIAHSQPPPHIPRSQHGGIATTIESYRTSAVAGLTGSGRTNLITVPIQDEQGYGRRDPGGMAVYTSRPPPTVMQPAPYTQSPYTQAPMPTPHQPYPSSSLAAPHQVASYQQPLGVAPYTPSPVAQQAGMPPHPASLAQPHPASSLAMQRPVMSAPPPVSHQGIPTGPPPHMVMPQPLQPQQFASPSSHRPYEDPHGGAASFPQSGSPQVQWTVPPQQRPRMPAPPRTQAEPGQYNQYF